MITQQANNVHSTIPRLLGAASHSTLVSRDLVIRAKSLARTARPQPRLCTRSLGVGVLLGPLAADALRVDLVLLVVLRDVRREGVVRVRRAEERLDGEQDGADLERG